MAGMASYMCLIYVFYKIAFGILCFSLVKFLWFNEYTILVVNCGNILMFAIQGRAMLPFSVTTEDGPIYVNPKQYHGILRRRKMRAKEGMKNRSTKDKVPFWDLEVLLLNCLTLSHFFIRSLFGRTVLFNLNYAIL